jgi:hypothetical protein
MKKNEFIEIWTNIIKSSIAEIERKSYRNVTSNVTLDEIWNAYQNFRPNINRLLCCRLNRQVAGVRLKHAAKVFLKVIQNCDKEYKNGFFNFFLIYA